jgi:hypothetical protein
MEAPCGTQSCRSWEVRNHCKLHGDSLNTAVTEPVLFVKAVVQFAVHQTSMPHDGLKSTSFATSLHVCTQQTPCCSK